MATATVNGKSIVHEVIGPILTAQEDYKNDTQFNETNFIKMEFLNLFLKHDEVIRVLEA